MKTNPENVKWAGRMALIIFLVAVADALVALFVQRPLPWVVFVSALVPVLTCVFVVLPLMKADKKYKS